MGKIIFESDDPDAVDAFEERMVDAMMNCGATGTSACAFEGTPHCNQCPFSGDLKKRRKSTHKGTGRE